MATISHQTQCQAVLSAIVMLPAVEFDICSSKAARRQSIASMTRREKGPRCAYAAIMATAIRAEDGSLLAQLRKVRQNGSCASGMAVTTRCTVSNAAYLETEVTDRQLATLPRTVEHRHQSVNTARIGGRVVDALQNLSVVHQDVAQRTRRIEIYAIRALIAARARP